jgi:glycerophosphoryl diester phosphodiesterase
MRIILSLTILVFAMSVHAGAPMIVAHRGASKKAPGNTIPAFELAWKLGADAIEADFHVTKDGHIVCIHDRDTKRVAAKNLRVSNSTLAELRTLDVGIKKGKAFEGTKIPTIAEVFAAIPEKKVIYVEIKCGAVIIPPLLKEIKRSGLKNEQIVVICFDVKVLGKLKVKAPELKVSWLCRFKKDKKSGKIRPSLESLQKTIEQNKLDGISSNTGIPQPYVDAVTAKGCEWHVWTVNDEKTSKIMKERANPLPRMCPLA